LANHLAEEKADSIKLFAHWKTKNRGNLIVLLLPNQSTSPSSLAWPLAPWTRSCIPASVSSSSSSSQM